MMGFGGLILAIFVWADLVGHYDTVWWEYVGLFVLAALTQQGDLAEAIKSIKGKL